MAVDDKGHLYIADSRNNSIRALSLTDATVSTFAGRGADGSSVANDPSGPSLILPSARLSAPEAVTADNDGNLYIADSNNNAIRRIDAMTGMVSTLAGSLGAQGSTDATGSAAQFNRPGGVTTDGDRLYVTDTNNNTIRAVDLSTGEVTTVAGMAGTAGMIDGPARDARFSHPRGIALDEGSLYVADTQNNVIRQIDLATKLVSTLAGAVTAGATDGDATNARFSCPIGLKSDGRGSLYVADSFNRSIRQIAISSGTVTTIAGTASVQAPWSADGIGAEARFNYPVDVLPDNNGHLYVADLGNSTIRMITLATRRVTTILGTAGQGGVSIGAGTGGLNWPAALALTPKGAFVVLDQRENVVLRLQ
jgi:sugar lactone lactonase YvrE